MAAATQSCLALIGPMAKRRSRVSLTGPWPVRMRSRSSSKALSRMWWTDSTFQWPRLRSSSRRGSAVSGEWLATPKGVLDGGLAGLLFGDGALDREGLADVWEGQVAAEPVGGPDGAAFEAAVAEGGGFSEVGFAAVVEEQADVVEEGGLAGLGGEHEVGAAVAEEGGEPALGEQGVGGEGAVLEVEFEVVEQGEDHADLDPTACGRRALGLVVGADGQAVDFSWVWVTPLRWPTAPRTCTWRRFLPTLPAAGCAAATSSSSVQTALRRVLPSMAMASSGLAWSAWKRCRARSSWSGSTRTGTSRTTNSLGASWRPPRRRQRNRSRARERLQQQMPEARRPVAGQASLAQRQHPRAEVRRTRARQDQEPAVVRDQVQPVVLGAEVPADPAVARAALQRRRREAPAHSPRRCATCHSVSPIFGSAPRKWCAAISSRQRPSSPADTGSTDTSRSSTAAPASLRTAPLSTRVRGGCPAFVPTRCLRSPSGSGQIRPVQASRRRAAVLVFGVREAQPCNPRLCWRSARQLLPGWAVDVFSFSLGQASPRGDAPVLSLPPPAQPRS